MSDSPKEQLTGNLRHNGAENFLGRKTTQKLKLRSKVRVMTPQQEVELSHAVDLLLAAFVRRQLNEGEQKCSTIRRS